MLDDEELEARATVWARSRVRTDTIPPFDWHAVRTRTRELERRGLRAAWVFGVALGLGISGVALAANGTFGNWALKVTESIGHYTITSGYGALPSGQTGQAVPVDNIVTLPEATANAAQEGLAFIAPAGLPAGSQLSEVEESALAKPFIVGLLYSLPDGQQYTITEAPSTVTELPGGAESRYALPDGSRVTIAKGPQEELTTVAPIGTQFSTQITLSPVGGSLGAQHLPGVTWVLSRSQSTVERTLNGGHAPQTMSGNVWTVNGTRVTVVGSLSQSQQIAITAAMSSSQ